jgi:hypothetical protein
MTISGSIIFRIRTVPAKFSEKFATHLMANNFSENVAVYEIRKENHVEPDRPQMATQYGA